MFLGLFDPMYYLMVLPALLLGMYAQYKVQSAFRKYQQVPNRARMTGMEAAERILRNNGMGNVSLHVTRGTLTDHYDPRNNSLHLSEAVAHSASVAALGIAAHEIGHAMQKRDSYVPMTLRTAIVPLVRIGSWVGPLLFIVGLMLAASGLAVAGLVLFSGTLVFSLVTLPVEFNASNRAVAMLTQSGIVTNREEEKGVRAVLSGAALTYVAAAVQSLMTILYYVMLLTGGRRRRF
jgi:uncharacterized protein